MYVEAALYNRLTGDPTVSGMVGLRVYPHLLPQNPTYPAITFNRVATVPVSVLTGAQEMSFHTMQVSAWSPSYGTAHIVASGIRHALDGNNATRFVNQIDLFDEAARLHYCALDFSIAYLD